MPGPAEDGRTTETSFEGRTLAARKWCLPTVGPGKVFGAVIGRENYDGVVVNPHVLELLHHCTGDVIKLRHPGFFDGPTVLGCAHGVVFRRQVRDDMHARGVEPEEERLAVALGFVEERHCIREDLVVNCFHSFRTKFSIVLDFLLAYFPPEW